jgi:hypothetical protein
MRAIVLAVALALMPVVANAQSEQTITTEPVAPSVTESTASPAEMAPMPTHLASVDGYRIAAISAGAVVGVIVVNMATGGMATPVMAGSMANGVVLMNTGTWLTTVSELAVTAVGAIGGGYVGDWLYNQ